MHQNVGTQCPCPYIPCGYSNSGAVHLLMQHCSHLGIEIGTLCSAGQHPWLWVIVAAVLGCWNIFTHVTKAIFLVIGKAFSFYFAVVHATYNATWFAAMPIEYALSFHCLQSVSLGLPVFYSEIYIHTTTGDSKLSNYISVPWAFLAHCLLSSVMQNGWTDCSLWLWAFHPCHSNQYPGVNPGWLSGSPDPSLNFACGAPRGSALLGGKCSHVLVSQLSHELTAPLPLIKNLDPPLDILNRLVLTWTGDNSLEMSTEINARLQASMTCFSANLERSSAAFFYLSPTPIWGE